MCVCVSRERARRRAPWPFGDGVLECAPGFDQQWYDGWSGLRCRVRGAQGLEQSARETEWCFTAINCSIYRTLASLHRRARKALAATAYAVEKLHLVYMRVLQVRNRLWLFVSRHRSAGVRHMPTKAVLARGMARRQASARAIAAHPHIVGHGRIVAEAASEVRLAPAERLCLDVEAAGDHTL